MTPLLECRGVSRRFGGLIAVNRVTLHAVAGEILGLIGPNGAGKTTLFRIISGVYPPTSGEILFKGRSIAGRPPHAVCHAGIVSTHQIVRPFHDMTVRDNVRVGAEFGRPAGGDVGGRVDEVLEFTGLAAQADRAARHLTLAGRKRLEIARALAANPELLLLDEVVAGLNATETTLTMDLVRRIRNRGVTVVMVEHVMKAVMGVCDRIAVLNYGQLIAEGSPRAIAADPVVIEAYLGKQFAG